MSLLDIRDQAIPIRFLQNIIRSGRVPNGMLFHGPAGVGKALAAREMIKALNCKEHEADCCGTCLTCRKIEHGTHPDVKEISPSGKARNIGVVVVDFMNELSMYRPFEGDWRVFIVHDVDRMRPDAQNHFLKTLEEPPSKTAFILLTEAPRRLLPTIRSRCQQVRFGALRPETVQELLLRDRDIPAPVAEALAAVSQGQMSRALDLVDSEKRNLVLDVTLRLAEGEDPLTVSEVFVTQMKAEGDNIKASVKADLELSGAQDVSKEEREESKNEQMALIEALIRRDLMEYLYLLETWYRDVLVYTATQDERQVLNRDQVDRLATYDQRDVASKLGAIEKAWVYIERNLNVDRVFRDLFFALAP